MSQVRIFAEVSSPLIALIVIFRVKRFHWTQVSLHAACLLYAFFMEGKEHTVHFIFFPFYMQWRKPEFIT